MYEKPKKTKKIQAPPIIERKNDLCKIHKNMLINYVCEEPYCLAKFCEKCKGDHCNHKYISIEYACETLEKNLQKNLKEIDRREKNKTEMINLGPHLKSALQEICKTCKNINVSSQSISRFNESMNDKIDTVYNGFQKAINAVQLKIDKLRKHNSAIQKAKGISNVDTFRHYLGIRHTFRRKEDKSEERAVFLIKEFLEKAIELKEIINEDIKSLEFEFIEDIDDKIVLSHLFMIEQEFINLSRSFNECNMKIRMKQIAKRFIESLSGWYLNVYDTKFNELYGIHLINDYTINAGTSAYTMLDNFVYFTGGKSIDNGENIYLTICYAINVLKSIRLDKCEMKIPRASHGLVSFLNKYIYAIGGVNNNGSLNSCEYYNSLSNKWFLGPNLNQTVYDPLVQVFDQRYIYVCNRHSLITIERLDLNFMENGWEIITNQDSFGILSTTHARGTAQICPNYIHVFLDSSVIYLDTAKPAGYYSKLQVLHCNDMQKGAVHKGKLIYTETDDCNGLDLKTFQIITLKKMIKFDTTDV